MRLPDGTILMHGNAPYDPVKAHEYYIRNRELTGRRPARTVFSKPVIRAPKVPTYSIRLSNGQTLQLSQKQLAEQQAYAAKRVGEIKTRLAELSDKLKKLRAAIKADEPLTAAEKSKAARESKQYREAHKQSLATKAKRSRQKSAVTKKSVSKKDRAAALERTINQVKGNLKAAVATQRALSTAKPKT